MKITPFAINSFANFMLGGEVFNTLKQIVEVQDDTNQTGEQKRAATIEGFKHLGGDLAEWMLNLGVELAVAWLKSKVK